MTTVSPRVTLEVLDWGGRGPALVFLAGLGSTAHVIYLDAAYDRSGIVTLALHQPAVPGPIVRAADRASHVVPYYAEFDATGRDQADSLLAFVQRVVAESRSRLAQFPQNQIVDIHGSNHHIFLQHPREVAAAMRAFLSSS